MAETARIEVTARLAEWAVATRLNDVPAPVRDQARVAIADSLGTALAGLQQPSVRLVREFVTGEMRPGEATVLGCNLRLAPSAAAFINAATAHALDYDSVSHSVSGFVATPLLFPLLALAELRRLSGSQLLEAFIIGYEVEASLGRGLGVAHYDGGWHSTATLGHLGAAVACAKLLGLDQRGMRRALGFSATDASGVRSMVGNMTNIYHLGKAARCGVLAALLVERGFTAHEAVLENDWGFCNAFNGPGQYDLARMVESIGKPWDLLDPGLGVKLYPCCALIHSSLDGVLDLMREHHLQAAQVQRVRIALHRLAYKTMTMDLPLSSTAYESKFCMPFMIAVAATQGSVKLPHFSETYIRDPQIRDFMGRVEIKVHPELTGYETFLEREFSDIALDLDNGRSVDRRVMRMANRGSRDRPALASELKQKFTDCAADYPNQAGALRAYDMVGRIEQLADIRELTACLQ